MQIFPNISRRLLERGRFLVGSVLGFDREACLSDIFMKNGHVLELHAQGATIEADYIKIYFDI